MKVKTEPSPGVKRVISAFVKIQKEKYGSEWKEILSKQMAPSGARVLAALSSLRVRK